MVPRAPVVSGRTTYEISTGRDWEVRVFTPNIDSQAIDTPRGAMSKNTSHSNGKSAGYLMFNAAMCGSSTFHRCHRKRYHVSSPDKMWDDIVSS
ncbi:hypothetical protein M413DRAFT_440531 [Hebeloma cylindrosporum]|uniref:Uncharacterized protein n=1 Tax=Hebeloma cylindrosporum TaxID=76867 RepID=A0A0C3CST0_HEBCY|nr:hypothetical protein M413DRAFT_440531 [Hebeloma cylindrosporum h7]